MFGYGLLCWNPDSADPEAIAHTWARLTYSLSPADEETLVRILLESRGAYEKYTAPLGLCWMVVPHEHYGASPDGYEYQAWGTYHRANRDAVGIDRTAGGTGYAEQYPPHLRDRYSCLDTCPDELKLWFHRLRYDYVMADGRTLIQRIYDDHFEGYEWVEAAEDALSSIDFPEADKVLIMERMSRQKKNAREWRDIVNSFFYRFSGAKDAKGRPLYL